MTQSWRLKLRLLTARTLIIFGKLKHADYTAKELKELIDPFLPETFAIDVPISKGELILLEADISMPRKQNLIDVELFGSVIIGPNAKPIYRAHVKVKLQAYPGYNVMTKTVNIAKLKVKDVQLVNDEYAIIEDSRELLSLFVPKNLQNLVSGTVKSAFGLLTAGTSDIASDYARLYLTGSKQRILDYHRPQIEALVSELCQDKDFCYRLGNEDFEEHLFSLYGRKVVVEEGYLRFKF